MGLWLYNLLLPVYLLVALPGLLIKMRRRGGYGGQFMQRFASYSRELQFKEPCWWIHAVSVGEVMVALKLIAVIRQARPEQRLILSTTSSTGYATARERVGEQAEVIYNPLDVLGIVHRALNRLRPELMVLMESEIWPNLITVARKRGIPVVIANARLSPRSQRRYAKAQGLVTPTLNRLTAILVQDKADIGRWKSIGVHPDKLHHVGSVKFDPASLAAPKQSLTKTLQEILSVCWPPISENKVLLLGSSHAGEEAAVARVYQALRTDFPELRLILVPRHFERANEVLEDLKSLGLKVRRRSTWDAGSDASSEGDEVLLVGSTGELRAWYGLADVTIIGKSFLGEGGQNPVEPIMESCPVVFGPHMQNFAVLVNSLVMADGARQVGTLDDLETQLREWLADPLAAQAVAARGRACLEAHSGATRRTFEKLLEFAKDSASF